ncbi:MAG: PIN domain-containing protein [Verrucomicrobiota bacterium]
MLDSSAVLAMLFGEPGMEEMRALLHRANTADRPLLITAVNWAEVLYRTEARQGAAGVATARLLANHGPLAVVPVDVEQAEIAADYKSSGRLGLADAFCAALAKLRNTELVTADLDFKVLEKEIKITWLKTP